jgi:hypothetical protein
MWQIFKEKMKGRGVERKIDGNRGLFVNYVTFIEKI